MMTTEIIPYNRIHAYDVLEKNVRDRDVWLTDSPGWKQWAVNWEKGGPAFTLIIDEQVVGCAGVILLGHNRGEAWMAISKLLYMYPKTVFKTVRDGLVGIVAEHHLRRVQALVLPDFEAGKRFMSHLGFKYEGTLIAYGPAGEDFEIYGRIQWPS